MKNVSFPIIALLLSSCTGTIYTTKGPTISEGEEFEGIPFYGYKVIEKRVVLDRIRHPTTKNITHSMYESPESEAYCAPQTRIEPTIVADYDTQYVIRYEPEWFETSKFSVTLENGMLKSVNTESTPGTLTAVQALQGLLDAREGLLNGIAPEPASDETTPQDDQSRPITCTTNI